MKLYRNIIVAVMLLAAMPATLLAQSRSDIINISSMDTNYSVETIKVGSDGTKHVKVMGFGKNEAAATINAKRNAVHAALFRGFPAANGANATPAIFTAANAVNDNQGDNQKYFNNFFSGNSYVQYVNSTTDGGASGADRVKVKGGYEVKIYVQVMYDNLRRSLESDGIVKALESFDIGKLPTIMVVPSDVWCKTNGYVIEVEGQTVPDYAKAMSENSDIRALVSNMGDFMAAESFPIVSLEQELKRINSESIERSLSTSKTSGAAIAETPIEMLRRSAKADIILDLDFEKKKVGPRTQIIFNLTALDAYSSKIISGNTGAGSNSSAPIVTLLKESFLSYKDNFLTGLKRYYKDIETNGREVVVVLQRYDSCEIDFETEFDYNGQEAELADIVSVWFEDNAINGNFTLNERSANVLRFTQVRMPLYGKSLSGKEVAIDIVGFTRSLVNFFKNDPYNTVVKVEQKGLGEVWLIVGEK
ncbi:MAG: DUF6175 family protein [Rikenellaceae bacterium]